MEFRRITGMPPYVFTIIDGLKIEARRAGADVIDLGFGNPDLPSPDVAVDKLAEAAHNTRNHRYSSSRGIPKLRQAVADLYKRRFDVDLDPDTEVISTIGAKSTSSWKKSRSTQAVVGLCGNEQMITRGRGHECSNT